jgi:CheY-like chemotaxis protein
MLYAERQFFPGQGKIDVASSVANAQQGAAKLRNLHVLVVEDSWHVAHALKTLLEELEVSVAGPAATLDEAEHLLAAHTPDVAIVDINLKGEMAYGLIDRLNDVGVRVVVISGYAVPQVAQAKVAAVLQKPFSAKSLLAILRQAAAANEVQ